MIRNILIVIAALIAIVICAAALDKFMRGTPQPRQIEAVQVQDGRLLFGTLDKNVLCDYYQVNIKVDPKTKIQSPVIVKGGSSYGGDGCVTLLEPILWTENLDTSSQLYSRLSQHT